MNEAPAAKKRPSWVWVISIFYALSFVWTVLSVYLIFSGSIPTTPEVKAYFGSLSAFDYGLATVQILVSLSATVALFLLRRLATYLFWSSLAVEVVWHVWHIALRGWITPIKSMTGASAEAFIGIGILLAVCVYSEKLKRQGTLT
jgi:hypothetical protein